MATGWVTVTERNKRALKDRFEINHIRKFFFSKFIYSFIAKIFSGPVAFM